jgi:hypothetical protein
MSRGTANENEAAVAASKVQELLTQFNLSIDDVEKRDAHGKVIEDGDLMTSSSNPWRRSLANAIARLYFCDYYWQHVRTPAPHRKRPYVRGDKHNFIGLPHNVVVVKEMFVYLVDTVERLANEARKDVVKRKVSIDGSPAEYEHAFRHGCATRITNRIWQRYYEQTEPPAGLIAKSNVPALYTKLSAEVSDYMSKNHGSLPVKKSRGKHSSMAGVIDGNAAGDRVSLDTQIADMQPTKQIGCG